MHPKLLVPLILGVLLGILVPFEKPVIPQKAKKRGGRAAPAPTVGGVWSRQRKLDEHMDVAIQMTKQATGSDFLDEPRAIVSTPDAAAGVIREDYDAVFRKLGAQDDAQVVAMSRAFAGHVLAVYDPVKNVVHVIPENAVRAAAAAGNEGLVSEEVLELLLTRMAVIAQDRQLYPEWKEALNAAGDSDAIHAAGAVLQGHAQYETYRVAEARKLLFDFDNLVALLTAPAPEGTSPPNLQEEVKFAILKGHTFVKAVAKKKRRKGMIALIKSPPTSRNPIFDPDAYLGKKTAPPASKLPELVAKEFAGLTAGEGWTLASSPLDKAAADALLAPLPDSYKSAVLAAFQSGTVWTSTRAADGASVEVVLLDMKHEGTAEGFVNLAKGAAKERGDGIEDGAGRDSGLAGFVASTPAKEDPKEPARTRQWIFEGKYVVSLASTCPEVDRDAQDDALEGAAEVLSKTTRTRKRRGRK